MNVECLSFPAQAGLHPALLDPWQAAAADPDTVLAVLTQTHGPAYRNPGAALAIAGDGRMAGAITSGCIEADLALRADEVRRTGRVQHLRYGQGSPFFDLKLPCGGGIEVDLFALADRDVLIRLATARKDRRAVSLVISAGGRLHLDRWRPTGQRGDTFSIGFRPDLRFVIFGTGAEAVAFAGLVRGMGYDHTLISHEEASLQSAAAAGTPVRLIHSLSQMKDVQADADTAVVLFYHDHDYEPEILRQMLDTPAFYIGAQGSRATQARRLARLEELGIPAGSRDRVRGPIGLIPASRDPKSLALSVLAEVVGLHGASALPSR
ncbi:MAG: XdhC family protein [Paracoccaceae bacterium]